MQYLSPVSAALGKTMSDTGGIYLVLLMNACLVIVVERAMMVVMQGIWVLSFLFLMEDY